MVNYIHPFSEVNHMGTYLNPGNSGFARAIQSRYIDKTCLISVVNDTIDM